MFNLFLFFLGGGGEGEGEGGKERFQFSNHVPATCSTFWSSSFEFC